MEGQVLGNRYELIERIGGGGMALVYKAKCQLLNRFVAVKILRPEFTNDEEFVKRFRIEAQSAASLSHPNIVSIYDVGQEDNIHYIVMEFVDGITLKEYITKNGALKWKEAVNIAIQICSAIDHAHRKRIVHRDIKPHNILLTKEGIAKVTDFGIARAVSSSTITMVGSTIGSVHYFSPEQARGGFTDEKSDLYSLGIALYEMVTGRLPFDGETPVAVALKHIQEEALEPLAINNELPTGINDIIMKAIKKEQNQRYQTATDMLEDLNRVLKEPAGSFVSNMDLDNCPTKRIQIINDEVLVSKEKPTSKEDPGEKIDKKKDKMTWILAILTSLVIMTIFAVITVKFIVPSVVNTKSNEYVMENFKDGDIDEVKAKLQGLGFQVSDKKKFSDDVEKGKIMSQMPAEGTKMRPDSYTVITLEYSGGPELVTIEDFRKTDYREAFKRLSDMKLVPKIEEEYSDDIISGLVVRTNPDFGEEVKVGSSITIYKSKGPEIKVTKVPSLIGMTKMDAQKLLSDNKLVLGKVKPEDSSNYIDKIVSQEPAPNVSVNEGAAVNITLETNNKSNNDNNNDNNKDNNNENDSQVIMTTEKITLTDPDNYSDKVKVLVEITPSDTNKSAVIMNDTKDKGEFPLSVDIPVPENGQTNVKVYIDNKLNSEFLVKAPGR